MEYDFGVKDFDPETGCRPNMVSVDLIKAALGKGEFVSLPRETGKTTALLEFVHERDPGNVIVIVRSWGKKCMMQSRYKQMYPKDPQPSFISIYDVKNTDVWGTNRKWVTDEVLPSAVVKNAEGYRWVPFLGGVGTPLCMVD